MSQKTYEELIEENQKLHAENTELRIKVENQQLHINALNRYIFGSKRESTPKEENIVEGTQCSIFGEPEDEKLKKQVEEKTEEIIVHRKKNSKKQQSGIKKSELKNIEQETIIFKLEEEQQKCPECGSDLKKIGTEVVRQEIEYIPAKLKLKTYVREVYKCEECGTEKSEKDTATIVKANNLNIYKYIKYLLDELPQLEGEQSEDAIEKYLPWSKELPEEILNFQGTYTEINLV